MIRILGRLVCVHWQTRAGGDRRVHRRGRPAGLAACAGHRPDRRGVGGMTDEERRTERREHRPSALRPDRV